MSIGLKVFSYIEVTTEVNRFFSNIRNTVSTSLTFVTMSGAFQGRLKDERGKSLKIKRSFDEIASTFVFVDLNIADQYFEM